MTIAGRNTAAKRLVGLRSCATRAAPRSSSALRAWHHASVAASSHTVATRDSSGTHTPGCAYTLRICSLWGDDGSSCTVMFTMKRAASIATTIHAKSMGKRCARSKEDGDAAIRWEYFRLDEL